MQDQKQEGTLGKVGPHPRGSSLISPSPAQSCLVSLCGSLACSLSTQQGHAQLHKTAFLWLLGEWSSLEEPTPIQNRENCSPSRQSDQEKVTELTLFLPGHKELGRFCSLHYGKKTPKNKKTETSRKITWKEATLISPLWPLCRSLCWGIPGWKSCSADRQNQARKKNVTVLG